MASVYDFFLYLLIISIDGIIVKCSGQTTPTTKVLNVRLAGGNGANGRVEVYKNDRWGTVCDDLWDNDDAKVACRELGYPNEGAVAIKQPSYGPGNGPIHMSGVECIGSETSVFSCNFDGWDQIGRGCSHAKDAGVDCNPIPPNHYPSQWKHEKNFILTHIRLIENGRVDVYHDGKWGTICYDEWDNDDAHVVCKMLGYKSGNATKIFRNAGSIQRNMASVHCIGSENDIAHCSFSGWGNHQCSNSYDAGVACKSSTDGYTHENSSSTHVRIFGSSKYQGQVQIFQDGDWHSICSNYWDTDDATVFCRMLGFSVGQSSRYRENKASSGTKMTGLQCIGTETDIKQCSFAGWSNRLCPSGYEAGVTCGFSPGGIWLHETSKSAFTHIRLIGRMVDGIKYGNQTKWQGIIEVFHESAWGSICSDYFDNDDASVICNMLGFSPYGARAISGSSFASNIGPVHMEDLQCIGSEEDIALCDYPGWGIGNCGQGKEAGVSCVARNSKTIDWSHEIPPAHTHIRLVGQSSSYGRVEVFYGGKWGTICSDSWDDLDAKVVCRMLGFPVNGAVSHAENHNGNTAGPIHMSDVTCSGIELDISQCNLGRDYDSDNVCNTGKDAWVHCQPTRVRLNGNYEYQGKVEVFYNGKWGSICNNHWDESDARVICRMLGFRSSRVQVLSLSSTPNEVGAITNVDCTGIETDITNCKFQNWGLDMCKPAGVHCSPADVRLVDGNSYSGRVEVLYNGQWGTICDDSWDNQDAKVICRMLGLSTMHAHAFGMASFGQGTGPIHMNNLRCTGSENDITLCPFSGWNKNSCQHSEDAGVFCSDYSDPVRLVDGPTPNQGRVEVYHSGAWGLICDDDWNNEDASVVCRMLGFSPIGAKGFQNMHYGRGTGTYLMDNVQCKGTESSLSACSFTGWGQSNCHQGESAGVYCETGSDRARIVGSLPNLGRVEVFHNGQWGYICDSGWDSNDAKVICRMLGLPESGAQPYNTGQFGQNQGSLLMDNVDCTGLEDNIGSCKFDGWNNHISYKSCGYAGVVCSSATGFGIKTVGCKISGMVGAPQNWFNHTAGPYLYSRVQRPSTVGNFTIG